MYKLILKLQKEHTTLKINEIQFGYSVNCYDYIIYWCMKCDQFIGKATNARRDKAYNGIKNHIDGHRNFRKKIKVSI